MGFQHSGYAFCLSLKYPERCVDLCWLGELCNDNDIPAARTLYSTLAGPLGVCPHGEVSWHLPGSFSASIWWETETRDCCGSARSLIHASSPLTPCTDEWNAWDLSCLWKLGEGVLAKLSYFLILFFHPLVLHSCQKEEIVLSTCGSLRSNVRTLLCGPEV